MSALLEICIVDDLEEQLEIISSMLNAAGYVTKTYDSGQKFLSETNFENVGCVLLDNQMPGLTGLDVQKDLNRRDIDVPIIFMSGGSKYGDVVSAVQEGALGFLQKPFSMDDLVKEVELALQQKSQQDQKLKKKNRLDCLTTRETEVYNLVITGHTNKAIARSLSIAVSTVEFHRSNLVKKLGVSSLAALMDLSENSKA